MERREFFKATTLSLLGLYLGCSPVRNSEKRTSENEPVHQPSRNNINPDPIFRAATVRIFDGRISGDGCLVEEDNNKYRIYTIEHVAKGQDVRLTVQIPGLDALYPLDKKDFTTLSRTIGEYEGISYYQVKGELHSILQDAARTNTLQPLHLGAEKPSEGELVAVPNYLTGVFDHFQFQEYDEGNNFLVLGGTGKTTICAGQSGTPVLKLENGVPTSEIYGFISVRGHELTPNPNGIVAIECSKIGKARAN